ncbi:hypothetical protein P9112_007310 [Eukaryota sp. TZLM1-RC]
MASLKGIKAAAPNPRGIPSMFFIESLDQFLASETPENAIQQFHDNYSRYKLLEQRLTTSINSLNSRIPEIEKNLATIDTLESKKDEQSSLQVEYQLSDNVSAAADVDLSNNKVCLWLGADVMVEYSYEEAKKLLTENLTAAKANLERAIEDLDFVRSQITITEVNTSRVFNYDVRRRREAEATK